MTFILKINLLKKYTLLLLSHYRENYFWTSIKVKSRRSVVNLIKHFTIIIYDSRVVLTRKLPIIRLQGRNYARRMFIRLATVVDVMQLFWWKSRKSKFSLLAEATRICHFKTNEQFFRIVMLKTRLVFTFLCTFRHNSALFSIY